MSASGFTAEHWNDAAGKPAGGITQGVGFVISWQNGPLGACSCPADNAELANNARNGDHLRSVCARKAPNGAFVEDVIAAAMDRIRHYQAGDFASSFNAEALAHLQRALNALDDRTRERTRRGVEGTHAV